MSFNFRRFAAYLFLLTIILYVITGYGITRYQTVEKLSFGLLTKALSFKIHQWLIIPLVLLVVIHLYYSCSLFGLRRK